MVSDETTGESVKVKRKLSEEDWLSASEQGSSVSTNSSEKGSIPGLTESTNSSVNGSMPSLTESEESGLEEEYTSGELGSGVSSLERGVGALTVIDCSLEPVDEVGKGVRFLSGIVKHQL